MLQDYNTNGILSKAELYKMNSNNEIKLVLDMMWWWIIVRQYCLASLLKFFMKVHEYLFSRLETMGRLLGLGVYMCCVCVWLRKFSQLYLNIFFFKFDCVFGFEVLYTLGL